MAVDPCSLSPHSIHGGGRLQFSVPPASSSSKFRDRHLHAARSHIRLPHKTSPGNSIFRENLCTLHSNASIPREADVRTVTKISSRDLQAATADIDDDTLRHRLRLRDTLHTVGLGIRDPSLTMAARGASATAPPKEQVVDNLPKRFKEMKFGVQYGRLCSPPPRPH